MLPERQTQRDTVHGLVVPRPLPMPVTVRVSGSHRRRTAGSLALRVPWSMWFLVLVLAAGRVLLVG